MTIFTWARPTGDDWITAADWSPTGGPPGTADSAIIPSGSALSIGNLESIEVANITNSGVISIASGTLDVTGSLDNAVGGSIQITTTEFDAPLGALISSGTLQNDGNIFVDGDPDGADLILQGTADNTGTIEEHDALLKLQGVLTNTGLITDANDPSAGRDSHYRRREECRRHDRGRRRRSGTR